MVSKYAWKMGMDDLTESHGMVPLIMCGEFWIFPPQLLGYCFSNAHRMPDVHDDAIAWRRFQYYWPVVMGIQPYSPDKMSVIFYDFFAVNMNKLLMVTSNVVIKTFL